MSARYPAGHATRYGDHEAASWCLDEFAFVGGDDGKPDVEMAA